MQGCFCMEFLIPAVHKALPKCMPRTIARGSTPPTSDNSSKAWINTGSNPVLSALLSLGWILTL